MLYPQIYYGVIAQVTIAPKHRTKVIRLNSFEVISATEAILYLEEFVIMYLNHLLKCTSDPPFTHASRPDFQIEDPKVLLTYRGTWRTISQKSDVVVDKVNSIVQAVKVSTS